MSEVAFDLSKDSSGCHYSVWVYGGVGGLGRSPAVLPAQFGDRDVCTKVAFHFCCSTFMALYSPSADTVNLCLGL